MNNQQGPWNNNSNGAPAISNWAPNKSSCAFPSIILTTWCNHHHFFSLHYRLVIRHLFSIAYWSFHRFILERISIDSKWKHREKKRERKQETKIKRDRSELNEQHITRERNLPFLWYAYLFYLVAYIYLYTSDSDINDRDWRHHYHNYSKVRKAKKRTSLVIRRKKFNSPYPNIKFVNVCAFGKTNNPTWTVQLL